MSKEEKALAIIQMCIKTANEIHKQMSKQLWEELREVQIIAEMSDEVFLEIPSHLREQMKIKRIDQPNFRSVYEQDNQWKELHKGVIEASKARSEREDEIRVNYK